jgi:phosphoglycerate kinase
LKISASTKKLASYGDIFINDAFGAAHRAHATTTGIASFMPAGVGHLMLKELENLTPLLIKEPEKRFVSIVGGSKVSDKIAVLKNMLNLVDILLIGGGMANTFLVAEGFNMGASLVESDNIEIAKEILALAKEKGVKVVLPIDMVVASEVKSGVATKIVKAESLSSDDMALDIGPATVAAFTDNIKDADIVVWNGPVGVFELAEFAEGTMSLAKVLSECQGKTIIGGGDTASAVQQSGYGDWMSHISTGGGASLEFLEGKVLPGVAVLEDKK